MMFNLNLFKPWKKESSGVFVPAGNGRFKEMTDGPVKGSINDILHHLYYNPNQVHVYHSITGTSYVGIHTIIVEIFTENIVFILTHSKVTKITNKQVFWIKREFRTLNVYNDLLIHSILEAGLQNNPLTESYLAKVLNLSDTAPNGIFNASSIGYYLYFNNGVLTDFQSLDGFNQYAKTWLHYNPVMVYQYELDAEMRFGANPEKITGLINIQANAFAETPNGFKNEFVPLHVGDQDLVNFKMLLVCHYGKAISLNDFLFINKGKYDIVAGNKKIGQENTTYSLGRFEYNFGASGELLGCKMID